MTIVEKQGDFAVLDDLTPFKGSWVALRDGRVVASAVDPVELLHNPDVRKDDWFLLVPNETEGSLVL